MVNDQNCIRVRIDPSWDYLQYWRSPLGPILRAPYIDFESMQESASVQYEQVHPFGRPEAFQSFNGVDNRTIPLTFTFMFTEEGTGIGGALLQVLSAATDRRLQIDRQVLQPAKFLEGLKYPIVLPSGQVTSPPPVVLQIGSLYCGRCICTQAEITWQDIYDTDNMLPLRVQINCTFTEVNRTFGNFNFNGPTRILAGSANVVSQAQASLQSAVDAASNTVLSGDVLSTKGMT